MDAGNIYFRQSFRTALPEQRPCLLQTQRLQLEGQNVQRLVQVHVRTRRVRDHTDVVGCQDRVRNSSRRTHHGYARRSIPGPPHEGKHAANVNIVEAVDVIDEVEQVLGTIRRANSVAVWTRFTQLICNGRTVGEWLRSGHGRLKLVKSPEQRVLAVPSA